MILDRVAKADFTFFLQLSGGVKRNIGGFHRRGEHNSASWGRFAMSEGI